VLSVVSVLVTCVAYTCVVRDKRLFLIPGVVGVGQWYNMLTTRSTRVLKILATNFGKWLVCTISLPRIQGWLLGDSATKQIRTAEVTHAAAPSDMMFNIGNIAVWVCCIGASFGWDERTVPAVLEIVMITVLVVFGDATCSSYEYGTRSIFLIFITLMCLSGKMRDLCDQP
jgi:hypothetical protein